MKNMTLILLAATSSHVVAQVAPLQPLNKPVNPANPQGVGTVYLQPQLNPYINGPALGNGRALEADFGGRGFGNSKGRDFMAEVRMRNNLVTGNAVGGRSLMIDRPYAATDEFYGTLGSDDLFSFRRDSIGTGAGNSGVRGTDSLQYQYGYTTSNSFDNATGISRLGGPTGTSKTEFLSQARTRPAYKAADFAGLGDGWSNIAPQLSTLRSTSAFDATRSLNPSVVGTRETRDGRESLTASGLLGLRAVPARKSDLPPGATPLNRAIDPVTGRPAQDAADKAASSDKSNEASKDQGTSGRTAYEELLERYAKAEGVKPADNASPNEPTPAWKEKLSKLKEQMDKMSTEPVKPGDGKEAPKTAGTTLREQNSRQFDAETFRLIREAGGQAKTYATLEGFEKDLYGRYMSAGGRLMADHHYFDAEEQFVRCLAIAPGDPTASAARLNAQLGAALFLSAAVNLKALYSAHPEVIGVRFTGGTMPDIGRLNDISVLLRARLREARDVGAAAPRDAAVLLAYVGYQTDNIVMTREGLDALDETYAEHPDPLVNVVRGVWLEGK